MVEEAFGDSTSQLFQNVNADPAEQIDLADGISLGAHRVALAKPWLPGFRRLGETREVQQLQLSIAGQDYFEPALSTANRFSLRMELAIALVFDSHVQNGGVSYATAQQIRDTLAAHPGDHE